MSSENSRRAVATQRCRFWLVEKGEQAVGRGRVSGGGKVAQDHADALARDYSPCRRHNVPNTRHPTTQIFGDWSARWPFSIRPLDVRRCGMHPSDLAWNVAMFGRDNLEALVGHTASRKRSRDEIVLIAIDEKQTRVGTPLGKCE